MSSTLTAQRFVKICRSPTWTSRAGHRYGDVHQSPQGQFHSLYRPSGLPSGSCSPQALDSTSATILPRPECHVWPQASRNDHGFFPQERMTSLGLLGALGQQETSFTSEFIVTPLRGNIPLSTHLMKSVECSPGFLTREAAMRSCESSPDVFSGPV